jgi:hypothetical protein
MDPLEWTGKHRTHLYGSYASRVLPSASQENEARASRRQSLCSAGSRPSAPVS